MSNGNGKIKGYHELTSDEISLINFIKEKAQEIGGIIESLKGRHDIDQRWLSIAETDLQKGFMAAVRSVARPKIF